MSVAGHHLPIWFDEATGPDDGDVSVWNAAAGRFESAPVVDAIPDGTYGERTTTLTGAALQAALTAKGLAGGGEVELVPNATYVSLLPLYVPSNVTVKMNGATISPDPAAVLDYGTTAALVIMQGTTDVALLGPGTIDMLDHPEARGVLHACDTDGTLTATRHTVRGVRVVNAAKNAMRSVSPVEDLTWDDNQIEDCAFGVLCLAGPGLTPNKGVRITRNRFRRVGIVNIQVYSAASSGHADVLVADNDLRDFDTPATAIPIEVTGSDRVMIRGNNVATVATRAVSTGDCNDLTITGNRMNDQTIYAVEIGGSNRVSITGNTAKGCKSFVQETLNPCFDVLITGNIYVGSGLSATATTAAIIFPNAAKRIRIAGNIFTNWQHLTQGCVRIGSNDTVEDAVVEGNTFVITDANTPLLAVQLRKCIRSTVARNTFRIERALVVGDDYNAPVHVVIDATSADLLVEYNDIMFTAAVVDAPNAAGISNGNVGAGALPGLTIRRNRVVRGPRGLRIMVNSADINVDNNDTATCTNADVIPATATTWSSYADLLTIGQETIPRLIVDFGTGQNAASGSLRGTKFMARKAESVTQVRVRTVGAAGATPTLCRIGIYTVDAANLHTLVASTPNDTTLFAAANTAYTKALSAPLTTVIGTWYVVCILVVTGATMPTFAGRPASAEYDVTSGPRLVSRIDSQADLPATFTPNVPASSPLYAVLLPA